MIERGGKLCSWTVFDHPADAPNWYVARLFVLDEPTDEVFLGDTLEEARRFINKNYPGLVCIPRRPQDNAVVVETWL
jgi:hypothetical protein